MVSYSSNIFIANAKQDISNVILSSRNTMNPKTKKTDFYNVHCRDLIGL